MCTCDWWKHTPNGPCPTGQTTTTENGGVVWVSDTTPNREKEPKNGR